jgi:hypothetical protein
MRFRTLVPAILGCALALGVVASVALAAKADTTVKVTSVTENADGSGHYEGEVKSEKGRCKKGRKIKVIHLSDPPFTIGETTTDEDGFWQLNGPLPPPNNDKIKVEVKPTKKCQGDSHKTTVTEVFDDKRGGDTAKTKVKITEGGPDHFEGTVSSKEAKCEKGRKVSLEYKFGGPYKGQVLDTVRTDAEGNWEMDGSFVAGLYLASVKEKEKGDLLCKAGKSIRMEF